MRKISKVRFWVTVILCLIVLQSSVLVATGNAANALRKVDDFPLYIMNYDSDYHFDVFLRQGAQDLRQLNAFLVLHGLTASDIGQESDLACSSFKAVTNGSGVLYGRNYDLKGNPSALMLYTHPSDGYASISMVNLNTLMVSTGKKNAPNFAANLLAAPYFPADGMNEHGVAVAIMTVPTSSFSREPAKVTIMRWQVIRLILDYARNVEEAITLLNRYNVNVATFGTSVHYFVADATGDSAVIEFIDGGMQVMRNKDSWQAATNFLIYNCQGIGKNRYARLASTLSVDSGSFTEAKAMTLLGTVSLENTVWSVVYNLSTRQVSLTLGRQYEKIRKFTIGSLNE